LLGRYPTTQALFCVGYFRDRVGDPLGWVSRLKALGTSDESM
jgi:hypothetical protein